MAIFNIQITDSDNNVYYPETNSDVVLVQGEKLSTVINNLQQSEGHPNKEVLDLLTTDGEDLFFNNKNISKIEIKDGGANHSVTFLDVEANNRYQIPVQNSSTKSDLIIQAWTFQKGEQDIVSIVKNFNNSDKNNFFYDENNVTFENNCRIKDLFVLQSTQNSENNHAITISKNDFIELVKLKVNTQEND